MKNKEQELLPCPFCGGDATLWSPHENDYRIGCKDDCIPCKIEVYNECEADCIAAWNTRQAQSAVDVEEIKRKALNEILKGRDIRHKDVVFDIVSEAVNHIKHFGYLRTQDSAKPEGIEGLMDIINKMTQEHTENDDLSDLIYEACDKCQALCDTEGDGDELER